MSSDTTNLNELGPSVAPPSDIPVQIHDGKTTEYQANMETPGGGNNNNNNNNNGEQQPPGGMTLDQSSINQIINGLQEAHITGSTGLPIRDVPMDPTPVIQDPSAQPNYIPPVFENDYIKEEQPHQPIPISVPENTPLENMYNEIQYPLLLVLLYFIFQLPAFKQILTKNITMLCNLDGNYNSNGLIFTSLLFGGIYYIVSKAMNYFI